ncbi:hemerythrin domain-containing protein [Paragemmobacter straminiformis]|uniref:Hemerythrin domain-containing protein n=1 Tax=Paragemmobacter straminiformis TaxID=2045119 RepID=A0A842I2X3_9RHOB|nr:hemerythrin domain-containing protein [Gemmobacter straminiformis]MBC2834260.1 hemerythrin domain-containing protein [Gemmobacter straminiformis]
MTDDPLALAIRTGLPPELLDLLHAHPRAGWPDHPQFHGLVSFWLDRHMGFRHLMARIRTETQSLIDGTADPDSFPQRLVPLGRRLVDELIGHHRIEDDAYFPELAALEPRLAHGFEILDTDHHALDALLDSFVTDANTLLQSPDRRAQAGRFHDSLSPFTAQLERHLADEEDLILPVILKHRFG